MSKQSTWNWPNQKFRDMSSIFHFQIFFDIHRIKSSLIWFQHIFSFCIMPDAGFGSDDNVNCSLKGFLSLWWKYTIFSMPSPYLTKLIFCTRLYLSPYLSSLQGCLFRALSKSISRWRHNTKIRISMILIE